MVVPGVGGVVMAAVLNSANARARKNEATVLNRLASVGLENAGAAVGIDPSTVSRWKGKEIPQLAILLAALGLKVVPVELRCYRETEIEALFALAKSRIERMHHAAELAEDDE